MKAKKSADARNAPRMSIGEMLRRDASNDQFYLLEALRSECRRTEADSDTLILLEEQRQMKIRNLIVEARTRGESFAARVSIEEAKRKARNVQKKMTAQLERIEDQRDELKGELKDVKGEMKELIVEMKEMKEEIAKYKADPFKAASSEAEQETKGTGKAKGKKGKLEKKKPQAKKSRRKSVVKADDIGLGGDMDESVDMEEA